VRELIECFVLGGHCLCGGPSAGEAVGAFPAQRPSCEANDAL
jgi:hypothetical protein